MRANLEETSILTDENRRPRPGSGSLLAAARKKQKRTVEEIAEQLNLSSSQIRTIELDQSEGLPEPTYVRGYIRSYAKLLDLDQKEILEHYLNPNWQKGTSLNEIPRGIDVHEHQRNPVVTPSRVMAVIFLAGVVGFLGYNGRFNFSSNETNTEIVVEETAPANDEIVKLIEPTNETQGSNEQVEEEFSSIDSVLAEDNQPPTESIDEYQLELRFSDTCWVDIRNENGEKLAYKSYVKGEVLTLSSAISMNVFVGNVSAVSAVVAGQDFDLSPFQEGVFARFSVPKR